MQTEIEPNNQSLSDCVMDDAHPFLHMLLTIAGCNTARNYITEPIVTHYLSALLGKFNI